jgi:outer membrane biosynthesis protein TonB
MATFSLVSMIGLLQIDKIIHGTLYSYGLEFSNTWARPYWQMTALIFVMGWFNIISALAFQVYVVTFERRQARRFADAVRDEVMRTRMRAVEMIRESKLEVKSTPAPQKSEETTAHVPAPTPEAETVAQRDSSEEAQAPIPTDQQTEQTEQPEEQQAQPQQVEPEAQSPRPEPQQKETSPETTEKKEETPIIVGIPAEELNAPQ